MNRPWTVDEMALLSNPQLSNQWIAQTTGRSEAAIRGKRQRFAAHLRNDPLAAHLYNSGALVAVVEEVAASLEGPPVGHQGDAGPSGVPPVDPIDVAKESPKAFGRIPVEVFDSGGWTRFGLVSDTHLCCKEERLDALHAQYDLFAKEGITTVFHGGNIVDGYIPRINGDSALRTTPDGQAQYVIDNYPQRDGMVTHFITGDDHESWFCPGLNFGAYLDMLAKKQGRNDLNYLGHVEGDVELRSGEFTQIMKIQHPGGGSAYARSYKGQKMAESFEGGEKPAILVQGHYHVASYVYERNIHIIGMPGFQSQTVFGRKKHLRFEIGGVILDFKMSPETGAITRLRPDFNFFFDRGFYKAFLTSDARVLKGHLVIDTAK